MASEGISCFIQSVQSRLNLSRLQLRTTEMAKDFELIHFCPAKSIMGKVAPVGPAVDFRDAELTAYFLERR